MEIGGYERMSYVVELLKALGQKVVEIPENVAVRDGLLVDGEGGLVCSDGRRPRLGDLHNQGLTMRQYDHAFKLLGGPVSIAAGKAPGMREYGIKHTAEVVQRHFGFGLVHGDDGNEGLDGCKAFHALNSGVITAKNRVEDPYLFPGVFQRNGIGFVRVSGLAATGIDLNLVRGATLDGGVEPTRIKVDHHVAEALGIDGQNISWVRALNEHYFQGSVIRVVVDTRRVRR